MCDVFQKWCLEVASKAGCNGTAGLVITMGHGEGREKAGSVNEVRMGARDRLHLTRNGAESEQFSETKVR